MERKISGEQLFRMTFSDGSESDHISLSKQDEVHDMGHPRWAGCNLSKTPVTQPCSSQMLWVQRELGTRLGQMENAVGSFGEVTEA